MSGRVPDFIKKNHYILVDGAEEFVADYYFTSTPVHNSDELCVKFKESVRGFDPCIMKPLKAVDVPDWLEEGAIVRLEKDGDRGEYLVVRSFWGMRMKGDDRTQTIVDVENAVPSLFVLGARPLEELVPVLDTDENVARIKAEKAGRNSAKKPEVSQWVAFAEKCVIR